MGSVISKGKRASKDPASASENASDNKLEPVMVVETVETTVVSTDVNGTVEKTEVTEVIAVEGSQDDLMREEVVIITKTETFSHQAGGHAGAFTSLDGGKIKKQVGKNEYHWYSSQLQSYPGIKSFVPACFDTEVVDDTHYVVIEDLTRRFKKPCILDIKMGTSSVGEDATAEKREAMHKKDLETTTCSLGIRITAMRVFQEDKQDYVSYGKDWGKSVTAENFADSLKIYFSNGKDFRASLVAAFLEKLREVSEWIGLQRDVRIYSSSLLFIYDGEGGDDVELKMIDFAHVHQITDGGQDEGYKTGMNNLLEIMSAFNQ